MQHYLLRGPGMGKPDKHRAQGTYYIYIKIDFCLYDKLLLSKTVILTLLETHVDFYY